MKSNSKGVMQGVKQLLAQGKSSREIIGMGYAPGTVNTVQHQRRLPSL